MTSLTGEIEEYMERSRDVRLYAYTDEERRLIMAGDMRRWLRGLQMYTERWVYEHHASVTGATCASASSRSEYSILK